MNTHLYNDYIIYNHWRVSKASLLVLLQGINMMMGQFLTKFTQRMMLGEHLRNEILSNISISEGIYDNMII